MTTLSKLRELNAARTNLRWIAANKHVMNADCYPIATFDMDYDAALCAALVNASDALLDVVEAAKEYMQDKVEVREYYNNVTGESYIEIPAKIRLKEALKRLEESDE